MRMIRQFVEAIARIAKLRIAGEHRSALAEVERLRGELFEGPEALDQHVDSATLAGLLRHPDRVRAAAMLAFEEGRIHTGTSDPLAAFVCYRRAHELYLEARAIEPQDGDLPALFELARLAPAQHLDPRYRPDDSDDDDGDVTDTAPAPDTPR